MLGPSGSGKTTCLRLIAGFEQPDAGRHRDPRRRPCEGVPPYRRGVNTVFQDYALFPHMSVRRQRRLRPDGPRRARRPSATQRARRDARAGEAARAAATAGRRSSRAASASAWRWPARWSTSPQVLLLDEPLGALDLKLREQMQVELKALQRKVGITFVFVTHDQDEALSMSDRVAVFNHGRIEQIGTPERGLRAPAHRASSPTSSAAPTSSTPATRPAPARRAAAPSRLRPEKIASATAPARLAGRGHASTDAAATTGAVTRHRRRARRRPVQRRRPRQRRPSIAARRGGPRRAALAGGAAPHARTAGERGDRRCRRRAAACCGGSPTCSGGTAAGCCCSCSLPPLLWLGVVYLGSLLRAAAAELLPLDEFSGQVVPRVRRSPPTPSCCPAGQPRHHPAHGGDGGGGHARLRACSPSRSPTTPPATPRARMQGAVLPRRSCCRSGRAIWCGSTPGS